MTLRLEVGSTQAYEESARALEEYYPEVGAPLECGDVHSPDSVRDGPVISLSYKKTFTAHYVGQQGRYYHSQPVSPVSPRLFPELKRKPGDFAWLDFGVQAIVRVTHSGELNRIYDAAGKSPEQPEELRGNRKILPGKSLFVTRLAADRDGRVTNITVETAREVKEKSQLPEHFVRWMSHLRHVDFAQHPDLSDLITWYYRKQREA